MIRVEADGTIYGVYERGAVDGIARTTCELARFITLRLAEDKSKAHDLMFACKLPDRA